MTMVLMWEIKAIGIDVHLKVHQKIMISTRAVFSLGHKTFWVFTNSCMLFKSLMTYGIRPCTHTHRNKSYFT